VDVSADKPDFAAFAKLEQGPCSVERLKDLDPAFSKISLVLSRTRTSSSTTRTRGGDICRLRSFVRVPRCWCFAWRRLNRTRAFARFAGQPRAISGPRVCNLARTGSAATAAPKLGMMQGAHSRIAVRPRSIGRPHEFASAAWRGAARRAMGLAISSCI
jgi:hypothetical protein